MRRKIIKSIFALIMIVAFSTLFVHPIYAQGDEPDISNLCMYTIITEDYESSWTWSTPCGKDIIAAIYWESNPSGTGGGFIYTDNTIPGNIVNYSGFGTSTFTIWETDIYPSDRDIIQIDIYYECCPKQKTVEEKEVWVRDREMTCYQVWINENNNFEFVFWWEYKNNNWVKIYDMEGNEVFSIDMEKGNARFEADLLDGFYTVKTFHNGFETPIQEFLIGKP